VLLVSQLLPVTLFCCSSLVMLAALIVDGLLFGLSMVQFSYLFSPRFSCCSVAGRYVGALPAYSLSCNYGYSGCSWLWCLLVWLKALLGLLLVVMGSYLFSLHFWSWDLFFIAGCFGAFPAFIAGWLCWCFAFSLTVWHDQKIDIFSLVQECRSNK
jgi:hypothetical protein